MLGRFLKRLPSESRTFWHCPFAAEVEVGVHQAALAVRLLREHPQLQYLGFPAQRGVLSAAESPV